MHASVSMQTQLVLETWSADGEKQSAVNYELPSHCTGGLGQWRHVRRCGSASSVHVCACLPLWFRDVTYIANQDLRHWGILTTSSALKEKLRFPHQRGSGAGEQPKARNKPFRLFRGPWVRHVTRPGDMLGSDLLVFRGRKRLCLRRCSAAAKRI